MGGDDPHWTWRDELMAHPDGRATGGEPCVLCGSPVPRNAHWKHRDRHVCGPRCNRNLSRRFNRMSAGATTIAGVVVTAAPVGRPNPRTRPRPALFSMTADPLRLDFDGYGPCDGDLVLRYGSLTRYQHVDPDTYQSLMATWGYPSWAVSGPGLLAVHGPTRTGVLTSAGGDDGSRLGGEVGPLTLTGNPGDPLSQTPGVSRQVAAPDGRAFEWRTEHIRAVFDDGDDYTWSAAVCVPAGCGHPGLWWSPGYAARSQHVALVTRATASHSRRVRMADGPAERFSPVEVFDRDGWRCGLCGETIDSQLRWPDPWSASLDHVLPLAAGGQHTRHNTQAAHLQCNIRKGARTQPGPDL